MESKKSESGALMIESSIIISLTLLVLICMLGLGFYLYQQAMLYTIASESAVYVGENYKYTDTATIDESYINISKMSGLKMYRTYLNLQDINKIDEYVQRRTALTSLHSEDAVYVEKAELIRDNIGRQHVEITISMDSDIIFGNVMKWFGLIDDNPKLYATAYAECLDLTGYASQSHFVRYIGEKVNGAAIGKIYNNGSSIVSNISDIVTDLINIVEKIKGLAS